MFVLSCWAVFFFKVRESPQLWCKKKGKKTLNWIMLKFHKNDTGEAQRRLCPLPGECMSQDPFLPNLGNNTKARIHWAHSRLSFFLLCYFQDLQSQTKDTECKRGTTVLVGNITKVLYVPWELVTTMQTGLFCVRGQSGLSTTDSNILCSDATPHHS